jgi:hypothetical protein
MNNALNEPLYEAVTQLQAVFRQLGVDVVVIGGVAVGLVGRPRYTKDLDAMVIYDTADAERLLDALHQAGFKPRLSGMADLARKAHIVDLNTRIDKQSGWSLDVADSINDNGQISGFGFIDSDATEPHAFLLTPQ